MEFSSVLKDSHFQRLATIIRTPFWSKKWRQDHADVPFWQLLNDISNAKDTSNTEIAICFCKLLAALIAADPNLGYTKDNLAWLIETIDSKEGSAVVSLLLAYASAPEQ